MMPARPLKLGLPMLLAMFCIGLLATPLHAGPVSIKVGSVRVSGNVKSLFELRWNKLTRQGWDISCGAAALSTLLTYYSDRPFSEMAITLSILKNSDPALVKQRGGFSLYDLKRFVNAVGLEGLGYGEMTIDDLEIFSLPAILPVKIQGFDHFVIFKKRLGNKILVGDPAFGNILFPADTFLEMWKSRIAFFVVTGEEKQKLARQEPLKAKNSLSLQTMEVAIPDPDYIQRLLGRIPTVPQTRK
jgi:predicted double-glycine peptidase